MAFIHLHQLLFTLILVSSTLAFAQTNPNIRIGVSISASPSSSPWLSPSGDFAFGFRQLEDKKDFFLLAIWYNKIRDKTITWHANGDIPAPTGSKVEVTADNGLLLTNLDGSELWKSENLDSGSISHATLNDTGNFVIWGTGSVILWESFKSPRDTLLPSQSLDKLMEVFSRRSETNFSRGRFLLRLQSDGDLVLTTTNLPSSYTDEPYYASGTKGITDTSSPGIELAFNQSGNLYVLRENGERLSLSNSGTLSTRNYYHRVTLNFDGVWTHYYHPKSSDGEGSWTPLWYQPENICRTIVKFGSGTCGYNSICTMSTDGRPTCGCPRGYSLLDPADPSGSCKPNYAQSCEDDALGRKVEDLYEFVTHGKTDWPGSDYAELRPFSEDDCKRSCLLDCMCAVVIYRTGNVCWKKRFPLANGRFDPNFDGKAFVKVLKSNIDPRSPNYLLYPNQPNAGVQKEKDRDGMIIAGAVLLSLSGFVNVILIAAICFGFFFIYQKQQNQVPSQGTTLRSFTYKELVEATKGFKEELGRGAFAIVYKGVIHQGSDALVAVKKLNSLVADDVKEFTAEINTIGQTHHKNLVRLLGFCDVGSQSLLVYEFMSNGNLSSFLFGKAKASWKQRTQIALGVARGLLYLHEECSTQIIHCDIKPQNILLDECYNAKISDFGLAKLLLLDQSQTQTAIRGTKGYVAPEWFRSIPITTKVDVYSYGVLLLEIICCRKNVEPNESISKMSPILTDWAYDCFVDGTILLLVGNDPDALNDLANVQRLVKIAIWCIQEDPSQRPTMRLVTQMLDGVVEVPVPPCPYPFSLTN